MRSINYLLLIVCSVSIGYAQDRTAMNRHKLYDTTRVEDFQKIKRRRLTADIDSTGITMRAWGDECYFKVNLLDRMLVNANFYTTGNRNGHPYMLYGNDNFRFRMYINKADNFEFDAIIRNKSPKGRYRIPFNIQTKGLRFFYQDPDSILVNPNWHAPDSVIGSYAVYNAENKWNETEIRGADTTYNIYGSGKAFHIYRPKVWDNDGDTVWGEIEIDADRGMMWVGADSAWMANATYPVTLDPSFGRETMGASSQTITNYRHYALWAINTETPGAGTITSADLYCWVTENTGTNQAVVHCYEKDATVATSDLLSSSSTITVTNLEPDSAWNSLSMSGTLVTATEYLVDIQGYNSGSGNLRIAGDDVGWGDIKAWTDADFTAPATMTDFGSQSNFAPTVRINYTTGGGSDPQPTRRRKILLGES